MLDHYRTPFPPSEQPLTAIAKKKLWETRFCKGRGSQDRERREGYVRPNGRREGMLGVAASVLAVVCKQMTTAVKRLNRYYCFYCWDFIYQLEKNGQRCINQLVNIAIFPFFSKFWAFFAENASRQKRIMFENGADNNVSIGFQSLRIFLVNF